MKKPVRQQIRRDEHPVGTRFTKRGNNFRNPGRPGRHVGDLHRRTQLLGQHPRGPPDILPRTRIRRPGRRENNGIPGLPPSSPQPHRHHPRQRRIRPHRIGHGHGAMPALGNLTRNVLIHVIARSEKRRNDNSGPIEIPQNLRRRRPEHIDEGSPQRSIRRRGNRYPELGSHRIGKRGDHFHPTRTTSPVRDEHQCRITRHPGTHHTPIAWAGRGDRAGVPIPAACGGCTVGRTAGVSEQSAASKASRYPRLTTV